MSQSELSEARSPAVDIDPEEVRALIAPLYFDKKLRTGEPFLEHAQGMVQIVRPLRDDADLLTAAYLFGVHDVLRDADEFVRTRFGESVVRLVADLRVLMRLSDRTRGRSRTDSAAEMESLRKMLLAMVNDLRVVILRLASRLQTLRWFAANEDPGAEDFARETMQLYAPLANRLGIWQLKWELEDLAFRFLEPGIYRQVARKLETRRVEREAFIENAIARLRELLARAGIRAEVSGRPKHIYSIWNKMRGKDIEFEQLYDLRALRIIVDNVALCYQALSLVHEHWTPIASEYDDYIARPKPNGYQSLHTVVDDHGKTLEIQIRTRAMHEAAELGVAAHWRYKEEPGARSKAARQEDERIAWLRRLLAWRTDVADPVIATSQSPEDRIYVLTPQAKVVELPAGATPIDFAYHLHTELGHRCRGARVNGAMVPLNTPLATGQTVEITAAKIGGPSRDWLNVDLGFLASPRSRAKARQWFNAQEHEQSIVAGREIINRELARLGKTAVKLDDLARRLGFSGVNDLCVAATKEEFSLRSVEQSFTTPAEQQEPTRTMLPAINKTAPAAKGQVLVVGVDSLLTSLARCCRPVPPDDIVGFVTRGKGVSIHRASCVNGRALSRRSPERLIDVTWGRQTDMAYPVDVFVLAHDRHALLRDMSEVFLREKMNVIGVNTLSQRGQAQMQFTVEVSDADALRRALKQLAEIKGVISARRR